MSDYSFYGFIIFCVLVYIISNIISNKYRTYNCICLLVILSSFYIINYIYDDNKNLENYSITIKELAEEKHLEYGYMCISSEDETKLDVKLDKNIKYKITFSKYGIKDIYVGNDIKYYYINRVYYKEFEDYYNDDRYHESDRVVLNKVDYNCN